MSEKFDLGLEESLTLLAQFMQSIGQAGQSLDRLEGTAKKASAGIGKVAQTATRHFDRLEKSVETTTKNVEAAQQGILQAQGAAQALFQQMTIASVKATTAMAAWNGKLSGMNALLGDTASKNNFVKWAEKTHLVQTNINNSLKYYQAALKATSSAENRSQQITMAKISAKNKLLTSETRLSLANKQLREDLRLQRTEAGKANAVLAARHSHLVKQQTEEANLRAQLQEVTRAYQGVLGELRRKTAVQAEANKGVQQAATFAQRESNAAAELTRTIQSMVDGKQRFLAVNGQVLGNLRREATEGVRLKGRYEELLRTNAGMVDGMQRKIAVQTAVNQGATQEATFAQRQVNALQEMTRVIESLVNGDMRRIAIMSQIAAGIRNEATETERLKAKNQELLRTQAGLQSGMQRANAIQSTVNQGLVQGATFTQRQANATAEMARTIESLRNGEMRRLSVMGQTAANVKREATEAERLKGRYAELQRVGASLLTGGMRRIAVQQQINAGSAQAATFAQRESNQLRELLRQMESLHGGHREQIILLQLQKQAREREITEEERNRLKIAELERTMRSLNGGTAEQVARLEALVSARRKEVGEAARQAAGIRTSAQVKKAEQDATRQLEAAQRSLNAERERAQNRLARMRAEAQLLRSGQGVQLAMLEREIQLQKERNRLLAMSTRELFGFGAAQRNKVRYIDAANQSGAILRATLGGLKANIGMYTSSTILAASATYAFTRALRSSLEVGSEYEYTMSRVQAIMTGSFSAERQTATMQNMNEMIRGLAMSTRYMATDVAGGMMELGMAGLSAGQSMAALRPALDLAMIGNISMSESADIATNIMMMFGKEAKDLGDIVDKMSMAITNSNTTISQMANALSYVGPAAEAAGFSFEDTVASIEVLANSGIKASRAGTGLRRMMSNLVNPTEKGAAVLSKYAVSVHDAAGNTREFSDIIKQLNSGLFADGVTDAERLAAIVDLVGVRAASAAATIIKSANAGGQFEALHRQIMNAEGAAGRMMKTIQDNLSTDWLTLKSAFQEVQLTGLEAQSARIRNLLMSTAQTLTSLTLVDKEGISKLDIYIQRAENAAKIIGVLGAGFVATKVFSGNMMSALNHDFNSWNTALQRVAAQTKLNQLMHQAFGASVHETSAAIRAQTAALSVWHMTLARGTAAVAWLGATLQKVAAGAAVLSRALGWIGMIASIGWAIKEAFSSDAVEDIKAHRDSIDELTSSYQKYRKAVEEAAYARETRAVIRTIDENDKAIEELKAKIDQINQVMDNSLTAPAVVEVLRLDLRGLESDLNRLEADQVSLRERRDSLGSLASEMAEASDDLMNQVIRLNNAKQNMATIQRELELTASSAPESVNLQYVKRLHNLAQEIEDAEASVAKAVETAKKVREMRVIATDQLDYGQQAFAQGELADAVLQHATNAEKLKKVQEDLAKATSEYHDAYKKVQEAQESNDAGLGDLVAAQGAQERMNKLMLEYYNISHTVNEEKKRYSEQLASITDQVAFYGMTEEEQLTHLQAKLEEVNRELFLRRNLAEESNMVMVDGIRTEVDLLTEWLRLRQQIDGMEKKGNKPAGRDKEAQELERRISQARSAFETLRQKFDEVGHSLREMNVGIEQMDLLKSQVDANKISAEEYAKAVYQLRLAHLEVVAAQQKHDDSLTKLRDSYLQSPFSGAINDLATLNRLLDEGKIKMYEYEAIRAQIAQKNKDQVMSGLPQADFQFEGASATPLNEWARAEMERAKGMQQFGKAETGLSTDLVNEQMLIGAQFEEKMRIEEEQHLRRMEAAAGFRELELAAQIEHDEKVIALEEEKYARIRGAHETFNEASVVLTEQRAAYEQQMNHMVMMGMMNTAQGILGMFAAVGDQATTAQKLAFLAQQGIAVAQILMQTHVAAANAKAALPPGVGDAMAAKIMALGYASAGVVGGLAITKLATGGGGGGGYAGAYDKGGWIPAGKWGVVGEYGPEMVHGPAHVTGRERTASKYGSGGGSEVTIAPQINVTVEAQEGGEDSAERYGKVLAEAINASIVTFFREQTRPNGMLDSWVRSRS